MRVLVACEESQAVTIEMRRLGHEAYSCDLQECSGGHPEWHIKADALEIIKLKWDMIIAHPPCTYLSNAGASNFTQKWATDEYREWRKEEQKKAATFFLEFVNADCPRVAIENPPGYMNTHYRKPDQIIHPYHFGHEVNKPTCLWLKGLPPLFATQITPRGEMTTWGGVKTTKKCLYGTRRRREGVGTPRKTEAKHFRESPEPWQNNGPGSASEEEQA